MTIIVEIDCRMNIMLSKSAIDDMAKWNADKRDVQFSSLLCFANNKAGNAPLPKHCCHVLPSKLSTVKAGINADLATKGLKKYVVCPECNCIYDYEDVMNGLVSYCSNMVFKLYNTLKIRCYAPLIAKDSNNSIKPIKRYAYNSIKAT
ncbi:uncharacterized protein BX663DRAFT_558132 [Cokeromyces recurvatus]|uniref:uncharacterized protein n=1 Tax=Cokeromyces recurvatus TaxID=90255 RepID=UPI00221EFA5F|nr:uncharacterized protein BX663DRAFT_558132 [Cokeromyces recurvatus]KAI7906476.1 hypothetical protein BX663DRAFT_558132 [Cokeromyces recurvatus]